jgi:hypothetical protein
LIEVAMVRPVFVLLLALAVAGCSSTPGTTRPEASASVAAGSGGTMDQDWFWQIVEEARKHADNDPDAMAAFLERRFTEADDDTLRAFQRHLVAASTRLYTWRHAAAADMACGSLGNDGFTDWRAWVVTQGRNTFERIAADADNLADVDDLTAGCGTGELFGAAISNIYFARHGYEDDSFPILEPGGEPLAGTPPSGYPMNGTESLRKTLPRLARRT